MEEKKIIEIMKAKNYDLVVVTSRLKEHLNGQTVAWFMQAGINPTRVAIGMSIDTLTNQYIKQSTSFTINFIPKDRQDLIEHFGYVSGRDVDKFEGIKYTESKTGNPILSDAAAYLDCEEAHIYNLDGYDLIIGEVVDADYATLDWFQSGDFKSKAA